MRIDDLPAAIRDGRKSLVCEHRQCHCTQETTRSGLLRRQGDALNRHPGNPQTGQRENSNARDLDEGHEEGKRLNDLVAQDVHQEGKKQQAHAQGRH